MDNDMAEIGGRLGNPYRGWPDRSEPCPFADYAPVDDLSVAGHLQRPCIPDLQAGNDHPRHQHLFADLFLNSETRERQVTDVPLDRFPDEGVFEMGGGGGSHPQAWGAQLLFLEALDLLPERFKDQFPLKQASRLTNATAGPGKEYLLSVLEIDHALTLSVQPDERPACIRDQPDAKREGIKVDEFSAGQEAVLGKADIDTLSRVPLDATLSQEIPFLRKSRRESVFLEGGHTDREQDQREAVRHDHMGDRRPIRKRG